MALGRAFTRRLRRGTDSEPNVARSATGKYNAGTINRNLISLPTELISTTNVQALNAPDIRSVSSSDSLKSGSDSDFSSIDRAFLSNAGSDTSSLESSGPATPVTPPTEARDFFEGKLDFNVPIASLEAPAIPKRAASHSKKAHVELSRKKSIQRMSPPPMAIAEPKVRTSVDIFNSISEEPFARELAQVNEVAEDFGATRAMMDDEEHEMMSKGLCKFGVEAYLDEIAELYGGVFEDKLGGAANPWM